MNHKPLLLLLAIGIAGCDRPQVVNTTDSDPATVVPNNNNAAIVGVDVSNYQGTVDFQQLKSAGNTFVFVKATQGDTVFDGDYPSDIQKARAAGLAVGSYHYYMTDDEPEAQFANLSQHVSVAPGDLPPVVDIEVLNQNTLPDLTEDLKTFLQLLEKHYGVKPILYSGEYFANEYLTQFDAYPLWVAQYGVDAPQLPKGWTKWAFWQYSQHGSVPGVDGPVDLNRYNGDESQFRSLLIR